MSRCEICGRRDGDDAGETKGIQAQLEHCARGLHGVTLAAECWQHRKADFHVLVRIPPQQTAYANGSPRTCQLDQEKPKAVLGVTGEEAACQVAPGILNAVYASIANIADEIRIAVQLEDEGCVLETQEAQAQSRGLNTSPWATPAITGPHSR